MLLPILITIPALLVSSGRAPGAVGGPPAMEQIAPDEANALESFELSVGDYISLQRRTARRTPPLVVTADPVQLREAVDALGLAIRAERAGAREGEIFAGDIRELFTRRIRQALVHLDVAALLAEMDEDTDDGARSPVVNGPFPWGRGNAIWPSVLHALPALPEDLEYRFIGTDLVLVDIRANLVVDVLRGSLAAR